MTKFLDGWVTFMAKYSMICTEKRASLWTTARFFVQCTRVQHCGGKKFTIIRYCHVAIHIGSAPLMPLLILLQAILEVEYYDMCRQTIYIQVGVPLTVPIANLHTYRIPDLGRHILRDTTDSTRRSLRLLDSIANDRLLDCMISIELAASINESTYQHSTRCCQEIHWVNKSVRPGSMT